MNAIKTFTINFVIFFVIFSGIFWVCKNAGNIATGLFDAAVEVSFEAGDKVLDKARQQVYTKSLNSALIAAKSGDFAKSCVEAGIASSSALNMGDERLYNTAFEFKKTVCNQI